MLDSLYPKERLPNKSCIYTNILFVDPGLCGTGWAIFPKVNTVGSEFDPPSKWGVLKRTSGEEWEKASRSLCTLFRSLMSVWNPTYVVFEFPQMWVDEISYTSISRGDLFKLVYLIGGMSEICHEKNVKGVVLVNPNRWKGQLPKEVVIKRINEKWKLGDIPDHAGDAIGMGLASQGGLT